MDVWVKLNEQKKVKNSENFWIGTSQFDFQEE